MADEFNVSAARKKVIFVLGATATGKSTWAQAMAQKFNGVIFNCDSIQLYQHLNIGSAKPSEKDYQIVPHYLFDVVTPPDVMTTGDYKRLFDIELNQIESSRPIFLVGGTGFYFQAIEHGLYPIPKASVEKRAEIEKELTAPDGEIKLYNELKSKDPLTAMKISMNDHYRLVRAIEIIRGENKSLSEIKKEFSEQKEKPNFNLLKVGLTCDREVLAKNIYLRAEQMVRAGLREEVQSLLDQGLAEWSPLSSVGYLQTCQAIRENKSDQWLIEAIATATRQLAKKQRTWFKRDSEIFWIEDINSKVKAEKILETFIQSST